MPERIEWVPVTAPKIGDVVTPHWGESEGFRSIGTITDYHTVSLDDGETTVVFKLMPSGAWLDQRLLTRQYDRKVVIHEPTRTKVVRHDQLLLGNQYDHFEQHYVYRGLVTVVMDGSFLSKMGYRMQVKDQQVELVCLPEAIFESEWYLIEEDDE